MSNEVKLIGTSQVLANFSKIEADLLNKAGVAIQEVVLQATYEAKRNAPVDLGGLVQSINADFNKWKLEGVISANAPYAPYVEFGTGGLVEIPQGFEELAAKFKGKGVKKVNLPARPFLIPAAQKGAKELQEKLSKLVQ